MENPEHEIRHIVRSLCQGALDEQSRTLDRYFTRDSSFVHPFVIVPHFDGVNLPLLGPASSREVLRGIFRWYRMLSPRIVIEIDSALHDKARDKMYLDIRQTFSIWFVPFWASHVRLVTVLDLVATDDADYHGPLDRLSTIKQKGAGDEEGGPASSGQLEKKHQGDDLRGRPNRRWKISKQEDLYQVNEFLKFIGPLNALWWPFQLFNAILCVFLALFVRLSPWALQKEPAKGGVEAAIEYRDDEQADAPRGGSSTSGEEEAQGGGTTNGGGGGGTEGPTNGHRRGSGNSKASTTPSTPPKKSWKSGKKR